MSYTGSKSQIGSLTTISIGSTPVLIGEVTDISKTGAQVQTEDSTNLNSLSEEFITSLLKPGSVDITVNRVSVDAGQVAVETAFNTRAINPFVVTLPKTSAQTTTGDSFAFTALIEEFDDISAVKATGKITSKIKLKIQGGASATPWVRTAGS